MTTISDSVWGGGDRWQTGGAAPDPHRSFRTALGYLRRVMSPIGYMIGLHIGRLYCSYPVLAHFNLAAIHSFNS